MFFTPRWVASHVFAATLIVAFVLAGLWQIDRLGVRQDTNALIRERAAAAPAKIADIASTSADQLEYRSVRVTGQYDASRQILVGNRSDEGTPGFWAWTVLRIDDGSEIIVNRGFISRAVALDDSVPSLMLSTSAIDGAVEVGGLIRQGLSSGRSSVDRSEISRPNARLAAETLNVATQLDPSLYIQLSAQEPSQPSDLPVPLPPFDLSEGPHRSYAFQWFTFATIGLVGYGLVLRRIRRGSEALGDVPHG